MALASPNTDSFGIQTITPSVRRKLDAKYSPAHRGVFYDADSSETIDLLVSVAGTPAALATVQRDRHRPSGGHLWIEPFAEPLAAGHVADIVTAALRHPVLQAASTIETVVRGDDRPMIDGFERVGFHAQPANGGRFIDLFLINGASTVETWEVQIRTANGVVHWYDTKPSLGDACAVMRQWIMEYIEDWSTPQFVGHAKEEARAAIDGLFDAAGDFDADKHPPQCPKIEKTIPTVCTLTVRRIS